MNFIEIHPNHSSQTIQQLLVELLLRSIILPANMCKGPIVLMFQLFWNKGCFTLCGLAIYIKKYLRHKIIMETQIFHHAKI
jgi:hypothetical protein